MRMYYGSLSETYDSYGDINYDGTSDDATDESIYQDFRKFNIV